MRRIAAPCSGRTKVDRVDFKYSFPKPTDGTGASLRLEKFQQSARRHR